MRNEQQLAAIMAIPALRDAAREASLAYYRDATAANWERSVQAHKKLAEARRTRDVAFGWREETTHETSAQNPVLV